MPGGRTAVVLLVAVLACGIPAAALAQGSGQGGEAEPSTPVPVPDQAEPEPGPAESNGSQPAADLPNTGYPVGLLIPIAIALLTLGGGIALAMRVAQPRALR